MGTIYFRDNSSIQFQSIDFCKTWCVILCNDDTFIFRLIKDIYSIEV